jgi:hypothetical protein
MFVVNVTLATLYRYAAHDTAEAAWSLGLTIVSALYFERYRKGVKP